MSSSSPRIPAFIAALALTGALPAQRPRVVVGEVLDAAGRPATVARVHLVSRRHPELPGRITLRLGQQGFAEKTALTDKRGRFRIEIDNAGPFGIWAEHGTTMSGMQFPVSVGDFCTMHLEASAQAVVNVAEQAMELAPAQRVLNHPVEAWVIPDNVSWLADLAYPAIRLRGRTDRRGTCRFSLPPGRPYRVSTSLGKWQIVRWPDSRHEPVSLGTGPAAPYRGRLLDDATGAPVVGALVHDLTAPSVSTVTDQNGEFVLSVRQVGFLHVVPQKHQRGVLGPQPSWMRKRGKSETFRLTRGRKLSARLLDGAGRALAGARLLFAGNGSNLRVDRSQALAVWEDRVGADGRVQVQWLEPQAPVAAFVEVDGRFVWFMLRGISDDLDLGELRVSGAAHLGGKVASGDRAPLVGAYVYLQPAMPAGESHTLFDVPPGFLGRITCTDRGGRFDFDGLEPGRYEIAVDAPGHGRLFTTAEVPLKRPLVLSLAAGSVLRGVVHDGRVGVPAAGADVIVALEPPNPAWELAAWRFDLITYQTTADAQGRFSIAGIPPLTLCSIDIRRHPADRIATASLEHINPAAGEVRLTIPGRAAKKAKK